MAQNPIQADNIYGTPPDDGRYYPERGVSRPPNEPNIKHTAKDRPIDWYGLLDEALEK